MEETAAPPPALCPTQGTVGGSATSSHLHAVQQTWTCGPASAAGQPCTHNLLPCISYKTRLDSTLFWQDVLYVAKINYLKINK